MRKNETAFFSLFAGFLLGIYMQSHHPVFFRPWADDKQLYRGDKVTLNLATEAERKFYKGCNAVFITSVALSKDNVALVLLNNCDIQKGPNPRTESPALDLFRLRDLERAKE